MDHRRLTIAIHGMGHCLSGREAVERALAAGEGVLHAYVNALTEMAYIEYDPLITNPGELAVLVERTGFRPTEVSHR